MILLIKILMFFVNLFKKLMFVINKGLGLSFHVNLDQINYGCEKVVIKGIIIKFNVALFE